MTHEIYLEDSYAKECSALVTSITDSRFLVLDRTIFYPIGGGQPHDTGMIITSDNKQYEVVFCKKFGKDISHEIIIDENHPPQIHPGDSVTCRLDWERRHMLMRLHSAAHILSEIIYKQTDARITGNQLDIDKARIDLDLEEFDKDKVKEYVTQANDIISKGLDITTGKISRQDALKDKDLFSLADVAPKDIQDFRIITIDGFDKKACGGTHVKNTKEIGMIELIRIDNKGKNNRRIYFTVR